MQWCSSLEFIFSGSAAPPSAASTLALYAVSSCMGLARYSLQPPFLQHSAHYIILENNISSKLNMRKNMIVLTSECQLWCRPHCGRHRSCHPTLSSHSAYYYTILETETKCDCAHLLLWYRLQFISDQRQDFLITDHRPSVIGTLLEGLNGCGDTTPATLLRQTSLLVPELRP